MQLATNVIGDWTIKSRSNTLQRLGFKRKGVRMASWVTCTRKSDQKQIHLNLDTVERIRWNEAEGCSVVIWPGGKDRFIRVLEGPEEILANEEVASPPSKKRPK